ncbi:MAG: FAD:protein FMN transferase [Pirellulaceae bacterium]|nr:FAD:protein FMN transferase [Pirellulaceae bacterium]
MLYCCASIAAAEPSLTRFSRTGVHMGVEFEAVAYAPDEAAANGAFDKAFARIAALDKALSDYSPESELTRLSETSTIPGRPSATEPPATAVPIKLSGDLWTVLSFAQRVSDASAGAFDVTIGPLTKLWRRARREQALPTAERLAEARLPVGWRRLVLDPQEHTARLTAANMRLDLGGIAKGFAADEALTEIRRAGLSRALVRASGDIAAADPPPGETGWLVGIAPLNPDDPPTRFVRLANRAISTSGDARQHLVVNGRRYSHLIDPRTGLGIGGRSSVTVIAPTGIAADSLASAVAILGPEKGLSVIEKWPNTHLFLISEDEAGRQREARSAEFGKLWSQP